MFPEFEMPPLVKIKLLGELGRKFTREVHLRGWSTHDLMRGVAANFRGFREFLVGDSYGYRVFRDLAPITDESELAEPVCAEVLIVSPVPMGAGDFFSSSLGQILVGTALLGIGLATGGTALALAGASLALGGVASLFSKPQSTPATESERTQSFLFDYASTGDTSRLDPVSWAFGARTRQLNPSQALSQLVEIHEVAV